MGDISRFLREVGLRLREERERLELSQAEMGQAGGVNRNSQAEYEAGKRPFTIAYLAAAEAAGLDLGYVVSGARNVESMTADELELLTCAAAIDPEAKAGLLTVAQSMAGRLKPHRLHSPAQVFQAGLAGLPPTSALARMFEALLMSTDRGLSQDELAHELARLLPTGLAQLVDLLPEEDQPAADQAPHADDREPPRAQRT